MLITSYSNKVLDQPFLEQSIWRVVNLEITAPYFLVCSEIKDSNMWFRQTALTFQLNNLLDLTAQIENSQRENIVQIALISPMNMNGTNCWTMENVEEIWTAQTKEKEPIEIYVTSNARQLVYPSRPINAKTLKKKKCVFLSKNSNSDVHSGSATATSI